MDVSVTAIMLTASVLLFVSVFASKAGTRFGIPSLLLFLAIGMLFGESGIGVPFENALTAQTIGTIALSIILFTGGMETKYPEVRPVVGPGMVLATLGVIITALLTGGFIYLVSDLFHFHLTFLEALLMASVMSSTDSASVFSILRSKKKGLHQNLRPLLEFESGSNDPMAYILTIMLLSMIGEGSDANWWHAAGTFAVQMSVGAIAGYVLGRVIVWIANRINITNTSLYGIMLLALVLFVFGFTDFIRGNGYLAIYIAGLVVGNKKMAFKKSMNNFMDGFTWLAQIIMFLALGLLVNPVNLISFNTAMIGLLVGVFMIVVSRPAAVFVSLSPFREFTFRARAYVSWVGLRGAVPIIFATYPLVAVADGFNPAVADLIFNVVFFITIVSLVIQGSTVSSTARKLGLSYDLPEDNFGIDLPDKIKSALTEFEVHEGFLVKGERMKDISLPDNTLVVMVKRGEEYFVPRGGTVLKLGDKLLMLSDNDIELQQELEQLGRFEKGNFGL